MTNTPKSTDPTLPPDIAKMSFEEAMQELESLTKQLEDGRAKLDDAIGAYERGVLLKRHCEAKLREAQAKIARISVEDGKVVAAPFES